MATSYINIVSIMHRHYCRCRSVSRYRMVAMILG